MRRVLVLAYHFPPVGGAGVQRSAKFVRYLPDRGYEPVVVTGPGLSVGRWTPTDTASLAEIPAGMEVHRVPGPEPAERGGWPARAERWMRLPRPWSRWWIEGAVAVARRMGAGVDVIYSSSSPFESVDAAARLARDLRVPWVADLRDPWALDEMTVYPSALHRGREMARMRTLLDSADHVVMNTPEAARLLRRRLPEFRMRAITVIPNGYDATDFAGPPLSRDDSAFRIVHTGYLHSGLGRRIRRGRGLRRLLGGSGPVDVLSRSSVSLVDALRRLLRDEPRLAARIELHLAGVGSEVESAAAGRSGVNVQAHGYLPHPESVALMRSADLLFLPMHDLPAGTRASIVPGKTYEYLASGRPILAALPEGDARDLLARAGNALLCAPRDSAGMARLIATEARRAHDGRPLPPSPPELLAPYERRELTARLAEVFDGVIVRRAGESAGATATKPR